MTNMEEVKDVQNQVLEGFQLSPQQKSLWPEQLKSPALHARCALTIEGELDVDALFRALRRLVERHEILRTSFARLAGMEAPIQVVDEAADPVCERFDLEALSLVALQERLAALLESLGRPFDLAKPPLLRCALARLGGASHVLLMALPALCADTRSLANLAREVEEDLASPTGGGAAEEPLQYIEFSEWRHSLLEEPEAEQGTAFWRRQGPEAIARLDLHLEKEGEGTGAPFAPAAVAVDPGPGSCARLQERAAEWGVPAATVLLAAWQSLLRRLTGRSEIAVHVRFHGRKFPELQGACGLFEQYVPVAVRVDDGISLPALAEQADRALMEAELWQEYFVPDGRWACSAAFEVEEPAPAPAAAGRRVSLERRLCHSAPFVVKLACAPGGLPAVLFHDTAVLGAAEAGLLADRLAALLADALEHPGKPLAELEILGEEERRRILVEPNRTAHPFPGDRPLHRLFAERARLQPGAPAVSFAGRTLTFAELDARANRLAHHLVRRGVGPESPVVLCLERSEEAIVALLAILKAGGFYVPLDAGQPRERLLQMLEDARVSLVITERAHAAAFTGQAAPVICLDAEREAVAAETDTDPGVSVLPDHPAYLIFTSGSTGHPKGAVIRHRSAINLAAALEREVYAGIEGPLRVSVNAPLAFDASVKQVVQLLAGHCLVMVPEEVRREGALLLDFLARERVQVLDCTPAQLRLLLAAGLSAASCPDLRLVLVGGEAVDEPLWRTLGQLKSIRFWNVYGPTECTVDATAWPIDGSRSRAVIGRPLTNVQAYVLDAGWRPVPQGIVGELWIGGEGLARGYAHRPGVTADKFVPDPFGGAPGGRLYRTGDLARWRSSGELEITGRADHQVKVRGFRIELGEIEAVLTRCPDLRGAAVAAPVEPGGDRRLVAYVVPAAGAELEVDALRSWLRERLPEYMLPTAFVRLDALPLNRNGKVDRRALPAPDEAAGLQREAGRELPRTQIQEMLASLWADALGYVRIGIEANFFELGGHSLLATQLMARIRQALRVEVPLRSLFEAPTVAGLAEVVEVILRSGAGSEIPPLVPVPRDQPLRLSFAQQRLWFLDRLLPGNPFYNIPLRTRLTGALDVGALTRALAEIVRRHEVLRTRFTVVDGEPFQVIGAPPAPFLPLVDLTPLPPTEREAVALRLAAEEAARPFDLEHGPLFRAVLLRLGEGEHVALLTTHHAASDGWSQGVLLREIASLYEAFRRGLPSPLAELPVQYADFAVWQRSWLQGEALERQLEVWKRRLTGAPPLLELPLDRPRPARRRYRGARRRLLLPPELTAGLQRLCRSERLSTFMTLLGAFQALLARLSHQDDVSVGSPVAGRDRAETEGLIGFFVNTLVLRTELSGDPAGRELLQRVREVVLEALAHQDLPFEHLVDALQPERGLGHSPLFQVMLAFQNAAPEGERELTGLVVTPLGLDSEAAKFDLTLNLTEVGGRLGGVLDYDVDLFDAATAERILERFAVLLQALVADPALRVSELPLLAAEERAQVVWEWSDGGAAAEPGSIPDLLAASARRWPERVAVACGESRLSYRALVRRADGLAHHLSALGVGPEVRVALCGPRSPEIIAALLAVAAAGGAWVPLDLAHPRERLLRVLADSGSAVLITQGDPDLEPAAGTVVLRLEEWSWREADAPPAELADLCQAAYVIYTSGSTGLPKGVVVPHRGPCNLAVAQARAFGVTPESRVLQIASPSFDASVSELLMAFVSGASLVLAPRERLLPGAGLEEVLEGEGITHATLSPSVLSVLEPRELPALDTLIVAGEACPLDLAERWGAGRRFFDAYGPTEASVCATIEKWPGGRLTIGRPMAGVQVRLLDARLEPVGVGVAGELCVGGAGVARGYLGRPELTAERFLPDPWGEAGSRLYRTGDLGRWLADGRLDLLGRLDRQVKVRGVRIEPGEVEVALRLHPAVRETVVGPWDEEEAGGRLAAWIVPHPGADVAPAELRSFLAQRLPDALVPAAYVPLKALPLTPSGKIDRAALPAPGRSETAAGVAGVAPRHLLELRLCALFEEILGIDRVGVRDDFFALGGSSLLAVRLQARVERDFGQRLDLPELFRGATVEHLATVLHRATAAEPQASLVRLRSGGSGRPFFWVHPSGGDVLCYADLARHLGADRPSYGLRARALFADLPPHESVDALAAEYVEAVRAADPEGPYLLGGWSLGGVIALEMARRLRAGGAEVALLALLDTQLPDPERAALLGEWDLLGMFAAALGVRDLPPPSREELEGSDPGSRLPLLLERARAAEVFPPEIGLADVARFYAVFRANTRALQAYRPTSWPGRITFFRATGGRPEAEPSARGWAAHADSVELCELPFSHHDLVREPAATALAERLRAVCAALGV